VRGHRHLWLIGKVKVVIRPHYFLLCFMTWFQPIRCRVVDASIERLDMEKLRFGRAEPADTGRSGCDPRDLLKLYLYGYLTQIRSSRRLEAMWLLKRLYADNNSIAELRRLHRKALTAAGAKLVRFAEICTHSRRVDRC
jgi:transposase